LAYYLEKRERGGKKKKENNQERDYRREKKDTNQVRGGRGGNEGRNINMRKGAGNTKAAWPKGGDRT